MESLKERLAGAESDRVQLEEKLKHLHKLILDSSSIAHIPMVDGSASKTPPPQSRRGLSRTFSLRRGMTIGANLAKSVEAPVQKRAPLQVQFQDQVIEKKVKEQGTEIFGKLKEMYDQKLAALEETVHTLQLELAHSRRENAENVKAIQIMNNFEGEGRMELFKKFLVGEYIEEFEKLRLELKERELQLEISRADNEIMKQKIEFQVEPESHST